MVTVDCPWCEAPVALDHPDALRCESCSIEVAIDPLPTTELPLAA